MDLSIVIPTRDRREQLLGTVRAIANQSLQDLGAELIVVDDGSIDGLAADIAGASGPVPARVLTVPGPSVSARRNLGIRESAGQVILLLGDDTAPASADLLARHMALHREHPDPLFGVLGRIDWAPSVEVSDFMRWIGEEGFQFAYGRMSPGAVRAGEVLYASHVSLKRELLLQVGLLEEQLPFLGEDVELGIRLDRAGIRLIYHPELLVHHDHTAELSSYEQRLMESGKAARVIRRLWPNEAPATVPEPAGIRWAVVPAAAALARPLLKTPIRGWLRERCWQARLLAAYRRGYEGVSGGGP
jgi:glycosyltransferase involved in cell wall biosynthesis